MYCSESKEEVSQKVLRRLISEPILQISDDAVYEQQTHRKWPKIYFRKRTMLEAKNDKFVKKSVTQFWTNA